MTMAVNILYKTRIDGLLQTKGAVQKVLIKLPRQRARKRRGKKDGTKKENGKAHSSKCCAQKIVKRCIHRPSVWSTRESNTSCTMNAPGGGNKRSSIASQDGSQKKGKNETAGTTEKRDLLNTDEITTEINEKLFNLTPILQENGVSEEELKEAKQGFKSLLDETGAMPMVTKIGKLAARAMRYKTKDLTALQETMITKSGVKAEEWLFFATALANKEDFNRANLDRHLSKADIQAARMFLWKVAHTPPQIMCSKIRFGKTKASKAANCWFGAKTALGSWYHKKQKSRNLQQSLLLAEESQSNTPGPSEKPETPPKKNTPSVNDKDSTADRDPTQVSPTPKKTPKTKDTSKKSQKEAIDLVDNSSDEESSESSSSESSDSDSSAEYRRRRRRKKNRKDKKKKKKDKKKSKKTKKKEDTSDEEMEDKEDDMEVEEEDNRTESGSKKKKETKQSKLKVSSKPMESADVMASRRANQIRVQLMLKIKAHKKKNANTLAHELMESFFQALKDEDENAILMPWLISDSDSNPAITSEANFPPTYLELKKYMDRWRPKKDSNGWVKIRVATDLDQIHLTSLDDSNMTAWYDEYGCKGYLCPIQTADKTETAGAFLYSGHFIDAKRLTNVILEELKTVNATKNWQIACRTKACKEIEMQEAFKGPFVMAPNQLVHLEVEKSQVQAVHKYVYRRFNNDHNNPGRPGAYNIRYNPSKTLVRTGTNGEKNRREMLIKHKAVVKSLILLSSPDVKNLDEPYTDPNDESEQTLRSFVLNLTYPLAPKAKERTSPLFHSVDWASSGIDSGAKVYFTAYLDRAEEAAKLVAILPALVKEMVSEQAQKRWINHQSEDMEVEFHYDSEGNWMGGFTTEDDKIQRGLLEENMPYNIQLENMDVVTGAKRRILHADDASAKTFNINSDNEGHDAQMPDATEDGGSSVAAASMVPGGGGCTD